MMRVAFSLPINVVNTLTTYNSMQITFELRDLQGQTLKKLRQCLFLEDSSNVVAIIFTHKGCH